jgi:protein-disulfide isomerase
MKLNSKLILVFSSLVAVGILFFTGKHLYESDQTLDQGVQFEKNFSLFVPEDAPRVGSLKAKVFVVEFIDPQCETCRETYPWKQQLMDQYEGQIQWVLRYAPLHPFAGMAIELLEASRKQNRFWEALEVFLEKQPEWGGHHQPRPELLLTYLNGLGLDMNRLESDRRDPKIQEMLKREVEALKTLKIMATPEYFVNGQKLTQLNYQSLSALVDQQLARVGN